MPRSANATHESEFGPPVAQMSEPFERVERDVDLGTRAGADDLAGVENIDGALLAFADHDLAVDRDRVERLAHRLARAALGHPLVALADEARRCERGRFGRANRLKGEISFHSV